jgi:hypothetical protein
MTMRCKTVEYVFPQLTTSLASGSRNDFSAITLTIPETVGRNFTSVEVDIMCSGNTATGTDLTARLIGIKLGSAAFSDATLTTTLTGVGTSSQATYHFSRNVTSYFNTNFGGTSTQTCQVGFTSTGPSVIDVTVKLVITYSYNDDNASGPGSLDTRVKTIRIPLESSTSGLTTSLVEIGTNQVPVLNTILPEASKSIKQIWFEIVGGNMGTDATASSLGFALDAAAATNTGTATHINTNNWCRHFFQQDAMDTSTTHAFKMKTSSTTYDYKCVSIVLYVTYTYSHTSSSRILNSVILSMSDASTKPGKASNDFTRFYATIPIPENNLTLRQSAILTYISDAGLTDVNVRAGSQSFRTYAFATMGSNDGAGALFGLRIDSGGAQGSGITLTTGTTTVNFDIYTVGDTDVNWGSNTVPTLYLNYESDKDSTYGDGAHNHTTSWATLDGVTNEQALSGGDWTPTPPNIAESSYYIGNVSLFYWRWINGTDYGFSIATQWLSGESPYGPGWWAIRWSQGGWLSFSDILEEIPVDVTKFFKQFPAAPKLMDIEATRVWRSWYTNSPLLLGARLWITYHAVTKVVSGVVSGYSGNGSGITVDVYNADTKVLAGTTTTTVGGNYSITVYDGANYFAVASQDSTHTGRSATSVGV